MALEQLVTELGEGIGAFLDSGEFGWVVFGVAVGINVIASIAAWLKGHTTAVVLVWVVNAITLAWLFVPESVERVLNDVVAAPTLVLMATALLLALLLGTAAAIRLARPSSWWAQRRYRSEKYAESVDRYGFVRIKAR